MTKSSQDLKLRRFGKGLAVGLASALGLLIVVGAITYAAFRLSPWPSALLIRRVFDAGAVEIAAALEPYVPENVSSILDQRYTAGDGQRPAQEGDGQRPAQEGDGQRPAQEGDRSAFLNIYFPADLAEGKKLPAVV